jgi:thiol-disulfide isomerase/thioredoxin
MIVILIIMGMVFYPEKEERVVIEVPDISFTAHGESEAKSLQDCRGKTVLIHFWATWCPPCLPEIPELVELAKKNPETLTILAFSADQNAGSMMSFLNGKFEELPSNFIPIWDDNASISREKFQTTTFPETFIIGCEGELRDKVIGVSSDWESEIKDDLAACSK